MTRRIAFADLGEGADIVDIGRVDPTRRAPTRSEELSASPLAGEYSRIGDRAAFRSRRNAQPGLSRGNRRGRFDYHDITHCAPGLSTPSPRVGGGLPDATELAATMQHSARYLMLCRRGRVSLGRARRASLRASALSDRLDPGFGFGKTVEHNLALLRRLAEIAALGYPLLAGLSRKSTIGVLTGRDVDDRMAGSVAAALAAVARGAAIVRVHDVRETVDALKVWRAVQVE